MAQNFTTNAVTITTEDGTITGEKIESSETALMTSDRQARRMNEVTYLMQQATLRALWEIPERWSPQGTAIEIR